MLKIPIFGLSKINDSRSSAFKVVSSTESINLHNSISNIIKLSVSSVGRLLNNFQSLSNNYSTILVDIIIRVDYLDKANIYQYHKESLTQVVNICSGEYLYTQDNIVDVNILDLQILNFSSNSIDLSITFLSSLDT